MKNFLIFGYPLKENGMALVLLGLRLFIGLMMLTHGFPKLEAYSTMSSTYPDPLGLGSVVSLTLSLMAEVGCSLLLIFGAFTRLAVLPLIVNMLVAILVVHGGQPFQAKELAVMYLGIYVVIFFTGGGRYALDNLLFVFRKKESR